MSAATTTAQQVELRDNLLLRILEKHQLRWAQRLGDGDAIQGVRNALEVARHRPMERPSFASALHLDDDVVYIVRKLGDGDVGAGIRRALRDHVDGRRLSRRRLEASP